MKKVLLIVILLAATSLVCAKLDPFDVGIATRASTLRQQIQQWITSPIDTFTQQEAETPIYKFQQPDGSWAFTNKPPPHETARPVQIYRSDTNVIPAAPLISRNGSNDFSHMDNCDSPDDTSAFLTRPKKTLELINQAKAVKQQAENRKQRLDDLINKGN
ncbi:hypothetical protein [Kaarinaea lacus]